MAASVIISTGTVADGPGYAQGQHGIYYDAVTSLYWAFVYRSASATTLYAFYSADLITWSTPTNPTFTLAHTNNGRGACLGVAYKNISGHAVFWFSHYSDNTGGTANDDTVRATVAGTTVTWGASVNRDSNPAVGASLAAPTALSSGNFLFFWDSSAALQNFFSVVSSGTADTGAAAAGGSFAFPQGHTYATTIKVAALLMLSSGDNGLVLNENGTPNNVQWAAIGRNSMGTAANVFGSSVAMDKNDWGCAYRTDADIHVVRRTGSNSYEHVRWNGTSFGAGQSIPTQTSKSGAGVAMCSDGTSVWLFIVDSATGNAVRYSTWTTGGGWAAWRDAETSSKVRTNVTATLAQATGTIAVAWSQVNGTNFDYAVSAVPMVPPSYRGRRTL